MATTLKVSPVATGKKAWKRVAARSAASPFSHVVHIREQPADPPRVLAHLERELPPGGVPAYLAARKTGARSFVLWADARRRARLATVVTVSAGDGVSSYQVLGGHGEVLGTVVREKACAGRGLRTRWTVTQTGCPEAVGFKGRIFWWYVWWPLFPLWAALGVACVVGGGGDVPRGPRRILWRAGGETPLEFRADGEVVVHARWADQRLAAALSALVLSFDSWLGMPWDNRPE
ncbi:MULTISPECIES: hypothetical protein [unclassified Streptomyces]|uniref:hypothetical protein n=1 Tax=unclassified Streptomyces TaxID=2593676 RepID=UPI000DAE07EC|nr:MULTISPECIES: hypothetical protein [unclassified Streptomyces]PZT73698.1 hypothetical protein DNK55_15780 [Streptomyces sp. AC1-42T]PZT83308.1 hypothetical protein DNK56_15645 [Streptomyces sp. AC1-42W]